MKIDPYKHQQKYTHWKSKINGRVPDLTKENSDLLLKFLNDMEIEITNINDEQVKKEPQEPDRITIITKLMERKPELLNG